METGRKKCLLIISGTLNQSGELLSALNQHYTCFFMTLDKFLQGSLLAIDGIVIDIDLANEKALRSLQTRLGRIDRSKVFTVCVINALKSSDVMGAQVLEADDVIIHKREHAGLPPNGAGPGALEYTPIMSPFTSAALMTIERLMAGFQRKRPDAAPVTTAIRSGTTAMASVFDMAHSGIMPELQKLKDDTHQIADALAECGLAQWIDKVRQHHSATYQHCLIVTGVAVAFGQSLGFNDKDIERITLSGMLHDIGKALIPLEILEKPGPLTPEEWSVMQTHPQLGRDILDKAGGFDPEMSDVVAHHHEYLDGSGYPDKLVGDEISDIVRVMTISDIFGALIERRSYKAEMSGEKAFEILSSMKSKLDMPLVKAFEPTAMSFSHSEPLKIAV